MKKFHKNKMTPRYLKARKLYRRHRESAARRGIEFHFEPDEWIEWWERHLGEDWLWKRGHYGNQYVMARYYDDGPYVSHNVKCITAIENGKERSD